MRTCLISLTQPRMLVIALIAVACTVAGALIVATGHSSAAPTARRPAAPHSAGASAPTRPPARPAAPALNAAGAGIVALPGAATAAKPAHRAKAKAARPAKPRPAAAPKPRTRPGWVSDGHYLRSLNGTRRDLVTMRALGARDARRNPANEQHMILLDIGGQTRSSVLLSATTKHLSYAALTAAMNAYADGYHSGQRSNAPATIALGTNNDLDVSAWSGRRWGQMVARVQQHAKHYPQLTIAGANDVEPGFRGGPAQSRAWARAYFASTRAPLVFNGSADGCSPSTPSSHCNNGWKARDLAWYGAVAPKRVRYLPQIYNTTMAAQWGQIAATAVRSWRRPLNVVGPLTEGQACHGDPTCPTMPSHRAWSALWHHLTKVRPTPRSLPVQVDLNVR
jgi:hypothetical protein